MVAPSQRKIENIHAVSDCGVNRVEDVLAARAVRKLINVVGKDVVVPQPGARRYPGHVTDADAVYDGSLASHAGGDPGGVSPVPLDCLRVEALLEGLVKEDLGNNDFWRDILAVLVLVVRIAICCIALGKSGRIAETSWIEERVRLVDSAVDITNLNARPGNGSATRGIPSIRRIDDLVTLTQVGIINGVVLSPLYHRRGGNRLQRRAVELDGDCVE